MGMIAAHSVGFSLCVCKHKQLVWSSRRVGEEFSLRFSFIPDIQLFTSALCSERASQKFT